ncbi:unnamed protein product, partial [Discosporangium mesarthrocarpum]
GKGNQAGAEGGEGEGEWGGEGRGLWGGVGVGLSSWVHDSPPVLDVDAGGVAGVPSPLYLGREKNMRNVCTRALHPDWFISLLETCGEEAGLAWVFRLLAALLQSSDIFVERFQSAGGFRTMAASLPPFSTSLPVLLPALALALGVPIRELPPTAEGMGPQSVLSLLRKNAGIAPGPGGSSSPSGSSGGSAGSSARGGYQSEGGGGRGGGGGEDSPPQPFVRLCVAEVLLPALRVNTAIVAAEEDRARARARAGVGTGAEVGDEGEAGRAAMVNKVVLAAFWEAHESDPAFALICRSPEVVGAMVDALGGRWDLKPEEGAGGGGWGINVPR